MERITQGQFFLRSYIDGSGRSCWMAGMECIVCFEYPLLWGLHGTEVQVQIQVQG
ncbi:hypothetical protein NC652_007190 [Populus alba x Populus x berolinensis]|nr:hypothetical protein NC652_007190 [Populus alba x Populus x berolinensis]